MTITFAAAKLTIIFAADMFPDGYLLLQAAAVRHSTVNLPRSAYLISASMSENR